MKYNLVGIDGNAFSVMGYVSKAMRREGCSRTEIDEYFKDAKSSDYSHLLTVSVEMIDKLNSKYEDEYVEEDIEEWIR